MLTRSEYVWGSYATKAQDLYVIRRVAELREDAVPIPERSAPHVVSERYEVVVADLAGKSDLKPVEFRKIPPEAQVPADYEYVAFDETGQIELWGRQALSQRLKSVANIACSGSVQYDEQDSRVLYYRCDDEDVAYRFEPPYRQACAIRLGPQGGIPYPGSDDYRFRSTAGQQVAFITVGWGFLYEVDLCRDGVARELDRFARPDQAISPAPKSMPKWADVNQLPHRLLGIAEGMRLYQVAQGASQSVVEVAADGTMRRYSMPEELSQVGEGKYLAQGGFVIWNVMDEQAHLHVLHSLNLASGVFNKTEIPF
jgi:hypothetical protein